VIAASVIVGAGAGAAACASDESPGITAEASASADPQPSADEVDAADSNAHTDPEPSGRRNGMTPIDDETREIAVAATLRVTADGCGANQGLGTGTLIADDLVITAAHVVAGADVVSVVAEDGTEHGAEVVLFDPALDVALLRSTALADATTSAPVELRGSAQTGEVGVLALPRLVDDGPTTVTEVQLLDVRVVRTVDIETTDIYLDEAVVRRGFEIDGTIERGDSGALVVFPDGAAGLVWARSTRRSERAWAVELPASITDADERATLTAPVDLGACI